MTTAIYSFSGDPITLGHMNIVERASKIFDKLVVAIGSNSNKNYTFELSEREKMAKDALSYLKNVEVTSFKGLLVDFAYENDIKIIVRGIRNQVDLEYENILQEGGKSQELGIETVFLRADPELAHISSSLVKEVQREQGYTHSLVPLNVKSRLESKISGQYVVGITGEIAAGKTYIAEKLIELASQNGIQASNIDLDEIGHRILTSLKEPVYVKTRKEIVEEFGPSVKLKNGVIHRKKLGEIAFSDEAKLKKLNEIMHKVILMRLKKEMFGLKGLVILNAALFVEAQMTYLFNNHMILVKISDELQAKRLKERGFNKKQIQRRVDSQFDFEKKRKYFQQILKKDNFGKLWEIQGSDHNEKEIKELYGNLVKYLKLQQFPKSQIPNSK